MKLPSTSDARRSNRPPRRWAGFGGFAVLGACLLLVSGGCSRRSSPTVATPPSSPTEQRWIIGAIVRDLANMAASAAGSEPWTPFPIDAVEVREAAGEEPGQSYALTVRLPGGGEPVKADLKITGSAWSPELYVPVLRTLFARLKISPPAAANDAAGTLSDADLLKALATPLTPEMESQNQRLSEGLQAHPLDAQAHQQAALLLGTLAMRENSGYFWNPRGLCNRAAAHLAFARALRPEVSACGEVAELLIGLIIDTKADCQKRIAALQTRVAAQPALGPWAMAAALRNTRDYRLLAKPQDATLLERVELFRALSEAVSSAQAIERMEAREPRNAPDWGRIVLQAGYGVGAGHEFALPSTGLEMADAALVFPDLRDANTPDKLAAILNQPPGGAVQSGEDHRARWRVIDRGTWAQYFQRHLLHAADETYDFLQNKWGVTDEARSFRVQVGWLLKRLTLEPLCLENLGREDRTGLSPTAAALLSQHPEWVSDSAWEDVVKNVPAEQAQGGSWQTLSRAWFSPTLPTGTAYGFNWRAQSGGILPDPGLAELEKLRALAPLKYDVCRLYLNASAPDHHPTVERYKEVMAPLLPYDLRAMWGQSYLLRNDPARYGEVMNQAATLNPMYYLTLARYYRDHHMEPEAAQAYQAAIDHEADPVGISNDCGWLVNYYYDHDQKDRALGIARWAAEVYSSKGLETMAALMERMGRNEEAESYYQKIQERYNHAGPLNSFYIRMAAKSTAYTDKLKGLQTEVFPKGMEEVTLAQLTGKPTKGVLVHGENELSRRCGLKPGAIIVGIDGKRVRSMEQYTYVRALTASPEMDLLVYQDERYQAIHASVPERMFNLDFSSWP